MPDFQVTRPEGYVVMGTYHLRDKSLSLKAKGLLSMMLALPDAGDYSVTGLAAVCKEGVDAVNNAIKELESAGYITRTRNRGADGKLGKSTYLVREKPTLENPSLDNPSDRLIDRLIDNNRENNNNFSSMNTSINPSINHSINPSFAEIERDVREQIEYTRLVTPTNQNQLDELVEIIVGVRMNRSPTIRIGRGEEYTTDYVQSRFERLTSEHIELVLDAISRNTTRVRNPKAYLTASLFNSIATLDNHYAMLVNHDLHSSAGGW